MTNTETEYYKSIPARIAEANSKDLGMKPLQESPEKFVEAFLSSRVEPKKMKAGLLGQLRMQTMLLDPPYKTPKVVPSHRPPKRLSARKKRKLKLHEIPKEKQVYELYVPLHDLWLKYMEDLLQVGPDAKRDIPQSQLNQKVMKADYHGCILTVSRSRCPSYIGIQGIVLQETQNTLKLICKDDKLRVIPKAHSVFTFQLHGYQFCLYGNHMKFKASERSARKFKDKPTIDL